MMQEVWNEIQGIPVVKKNIRWEGPTEERIQELKKKLDDFKEKARKEKDEYEAKMKPAMQVEEESK